MSGERLFPHFILAGTMSVAIFASFLKQSPTLNFNTSNSRGLLSVMAVDSTEDSLQFPISDQSTSDYFFNNPNAFDLSSPTGIESNLEYDPETGDYIYIEKIGDTYYRDPQYISFEDFLDAQLNKSLTDYWIERSQGAGLLGGDGSIPTLYTGSELFDRMFGGSNVDIRPQGNIELTFGASFQNVQNPILTEDQQKQGGFDFDMDINANVLGQIGEKLKLTFNYNTSATFDFENQVKLEYTGYEDEIIKKIEAGNVSLPLTTQLIPGTQSLWGIKTQLQFGRLTWTSLLSQQRSQTQSIQIEGGAQRREFELKADQYDENRHFFMGHYFRNNYESWLSTLPFINSPINITRVEVWVTNRTGATQDTRDIVALADLGESDSTYWTPSRGGTISILTPGGVPSNYGNDLYQKLNSNSSYRNLNDVVAILSDPSGQFRMQAVRDFEKIRMRKLLPTDYTVNSQLGYISVNSTLQPDDVLAVAIEYTYQGEVFQVGEFANNLPPGVDSTNVMFLKMLKSTSAQTNLPIWDLMMKNVYSLGAFQVSSAEFQLDVLYQDPGGGFKRYIPAQNTNVNGKPLIKLMNLDQLNTNNDPTPDGVFDFVNGVTINTTNGRVYFPVLEPFGSHMRSEEVFGSDIEAEKYAYDELYNETKTIAEQYPQYNRYFIKGSYKSSVSSEIYLGAFNLPQGSVKVTAGGQLLTENYDYTIDYSLGRLKIINESILNSGLPINVAFENNAFYGFQVKSLLGNRFDYWINDNFTLGATWLRLSERPYTQKVNIGDDPISNTMLGFDMNLTQDAPWLTRGLDKLPFYTTKETSTITFAGEIAKFIPGHSDAIGKGDEGTIYIDDFEGSRSSYDLKFPFSSWVLGSTPQNGLDENGQILFPESLLFDTLAYGYNRAKLAWYTLDPLFVRKDNSARPAYLTADDVSNHYLVEIQQQEIFPAADVQITGLSTISTFDMAYYPSERGQYNFETSPTSFSDGVNANNELINPETRWGGIMRSLQTTDFESANIEFIEFWVMDPYDNLGPFGTPVTSPGDLYINLGNVSEDVLKDSRMFFENGLPKDGSTLTLDETIWGLMPRTIPINQAFDNDPATRENQDKGFDGMDDVQEASFYAQYLNDLQAIVTGTAFAAASGDPSSDNYHFFRGTDYDNQELSVLERYKKYNNPQGNSPTTENSTETYPTAATNLPETEDLNQDFSLNETESYYQYRVKMQPNMELSNPYITDVVYAAHQFENGVVDSIKWYQFKIPIDGYDAKIGTISDFRSIRFMRMYLTGFDEPIVFRFAKLELVRNQWRRYNFSLQSPGEYIPNDNAGETTFNVSSVSIEENSGKQPVPYVLPPGISREQTIGSGGSVSTYQQNEQALSMEICPLNDGDARAIFKSLDLDLRRYGRLILNVHGEPLYNADPAFTNLQDGDLTVFIRLGSDFTNNYYEFEIPLIVTKFPLPVGTTDDEFVREAIWATLIDFPLDSLVEVKKLRDKMESTPLVPFSVGGEGQPTYTIIGNPDLGFVEEVMIGVRNPKTLDGSGQAYCAEVWVNEFRLTNIDENGGFAALARMDAKLADLGNLTVSGNMHTIGFGQLEQQINDRYKDDFYQYAASLSLQLGKFFNPKLGLQLPFYISISQSFSNPEYDPYAFDVTLDEKVNDITEVYGQDSASIYRRQAIEYASIKSINLTNVRIQRDRGRVTPQPWDVENLDLTIAYSEDYVSNPILEYDKIKRYKAALGYTFSTKGNFYTPFEKAIPKDKANLALVRDFNFNLIPTGYSFRTEMNRQFGETLMRDIYGDGLIDPTYNKYFNWDRFYGLKFEPARNLKIDFSASNNSRIDEPYGKINTPEKKDTIWRNIGNFGRTITYRQNLNVSYNVPINKIPALNWITLRSSYNATFAWVAGSLGIADTLGNTISNTQSKTINGELNFRNLYNKSKFLKKYNSATLATKSGDKNKRVEKKPDTDEMVEGEDKTTPDKSTASVGLGGELLTRLLISLKRITINYSENYGTTLPGYFPKPQLFGLNLDANAPGLGFVFGQQFNDNDLAYASSSGWISTATSLNSLYLQSFSQSLDIRANIEPLPDLRVDMNLTKTYSESNSEYYKNTNTIDDPYFEHLNPLGSGNLLMSYNIMGTIFDKLNTTDVTKTFQQFEDNRTVITQRYQEQNLYSNGIFYNPLDSTFNPDYAEGYGPYSQDVLIPAFIAAYRGDDPSTVKLNVFDQTPKPNWRLTYTGLAKIPAIKRTFTSFTITSAYTSTLAVGSYATNMNFDGNYYIYANNIDTLSGNFITLYNIPSLVLSEQLSPLIGIDASWVNSLTTKFSFKKTRTLSMSFVDYRLTEIRSQEVTLGIGYRFSGFTLPIKFGGKRPTLENDLTFKLDVSYRDDITTNFRLDQNLNEPTGGITAITISPTLDYVINDRFNVQLFFNRQQTIPKISSAFPITTTDAGIKIRFSLAE